MPSYIDKLKNNPGFAALVEAEQRIVLRIFDFLEQTSREPAAELLQRHPSLISVLIENFTKKKEASKKGGRSAADKIAKDDKKLIDKEIK